jgi:hypothetical protein
VDETPIRSRSPGKTKETAQISHARKSPEKFKKPNMLPGFQNAFVDSSPSLLSQWRVGKGKQREIDDVISNGLGVANFVSPVSPPISPTRRPQDMDTYVKIESLDLPKKNEILPQEDITNTDMDIEMVEEVNISEEMEDVDIIEPFDWKTEVHLNPPFPVTQPKPLF